MKLATLMTSVALAALASPLVVTGAEATDLEAPAAGGGTRTMSVDTVETDDGAATAIEAPAAGGGTRTFEPVDGENPDDEDVVDDVADFGEDVGEEAEDVAEDVGDAIDDVFDD